MSLSVLKHAREDLIRQSIFIAAAAIALSVALLTMLGYWLTRSLGRLAEASREVAAGNLDIMLPVGEQDEVGQLTRAFNQMAMALKDRVKALSESEANLAAILNNIPDMVWLKDPAGRYLSVNEAFGRMSGRRREDVVGKTDADLWSTEWAEKYQAQDHEVLRTGQPMRMEERYPHPDGVRWLDAVKAPVLDWSGKIVGTAGIARDITERKQSEAALAHLNRLYATLTQTNEVIARIRDRGALLQRVCEIAVQHGLFRMAWIGMVNRDNVVVPIAYWGHEAGYLAHVRIVLGDEKTDTGPTGTALKRGQHLICQDIAKDPRMAPWREQALARGYRASGVFPLRENGRVVGAITLYATEENFFAEDIVELLDDLSADLSFALDFIAEARRREQAELELGQLNAELEQRVAERTLQLEVTNRELEAFSYSVSHDLRTPLRSLDGFSQILLTNYADRLDERGKDYLSRIRRASQRMGELIDDLLQLSRVARREIRREQVDLSQMARSVVEELREREPHRRVCFKSTEGIVVTGDAKLLRIVMENLLGNAWKFAGQRPEATIEFGSVEQDGEKVVFVRDNGAGFNMEYAHKLFGPFQRLHPANEFEGTGIGLATVQRIVRRHGGRVWGEGAPGEGATFYFTCDVGSKRRPLEESDGNAADGE